jgi:hypothetical protein
MKPSRVHQLSTKRRSYPFSVYVYHLLINVRSSYTCFQFYAFSYYLITPRIAQPFSYRPRGHQHWVRRLFPGLTCKEIPSSFSGQQKCDTCYANEMVVPASSNRSSSISHPPIPHTNRNTTNSFAKWFLKFFASAFFNTHFIVTSRHLPQNTSWQAQQTSGPDASMTRPIEQHLRAKVVPLNIVTGE